MQVLLRCSKLFGCDVQRCCRTEQVRLVRSEEIQDSTVRCHLANGIAQAIRRQPGKIEETLRPPFIRQHPAECSQRQARSVLYRIFTSLTNCQQPVIEIDIGRPSIGSEGFGG